MNEYQIPTLKVFNLQKDILTEEDDLTLDGAGGMEGGTSYRN